MTPPERWRVFQCYCCPPSVSRTLLKVHQWACSRSEKTLWVHLFDDCTIDTEIPGAGRMVVQERTNYPWDGKVTFTIQQPANAALKLRISRLGRRREREGEWRGSFADAWRLPDH